jgi:hypothetical protein
MQPLPKKIVVNGKTIDLNAWGPYLGGVLHVPLGGVGMFMGVDPAAPGGDYTATTWSNSWGWSTPSATPLEDLAIIKDMLGPPKAVPWGLKELPPFPMALIHDDPSPWPKCSYKPSFMFPNPLYNTFPVQSLATSCKCALPPAALMFGRCSWVPFRNPVEVFLDPERN